MLTQLIKEVYERKGLVWPEDADEALDWALTEMAECKELTLDRRAQLRGEGWVRNNPEKHEGYSKERLADELADTMFMIQVAGIVEGIDVYEHLHDMLIKDIIAHTHIDKE